MDKYQFVCLPIGNESALSSIFQNKPLSILADIGSCDALDTIKYLRQYPAAHALVFEPLTKNVGQCIQNLSEFGMASRSQVFQVALGDQNTDGVDFYVSFGCPEHGKGDAWDYGNKSSSLLPPEKHLDNTPWCQFTKESISMRRLDSYPDITHIDFIHMDVQGAELKVLEGMGGILDTVQAVWLEVENVELYRGQPLKGDVHTYMEAHGFRLIKDDIGSEPSGNELWSRS